MTGAQKTLLKGQALGGFAINFFLNGGLAYLTFPPVDKLPLWARGNCIGGDTIGTGFFLPLITCLVLTNVVRRLLKDRKAEPLTRAALPWFVQFYPSNIVARGALCGFLSIALCALPTLLLLTMIGITAMGRGEVTFYKAIYTAVLGTLVTPLLGLRALADDVR